MHDIRKGSHLEKRQPSANFANFAGTFRPGAARAGYQEVIRFMHFKRPDRTTAVYLTEFELPRRKAEAKIVLGGGSPPEFVPIVSTRNATLPTDRESLVLAIT